ncbi:MAG TPA: PKD domain-containing protein [Gemmatimonadales bacterium]
MRSLHVYALVAGAAILGAACGGDDGGNGPSNTAPVAAFSHDCNLLACDFSADASNDPDNGDTIASWDWDFGDGSVHGTTKDLSHTYQSPGSYHVKLTVTDNHGLASTAADSTIAVSDVPNNTNPTADFGFTCNGLDCSFTDQSSDADLGDAPTAWDWDFGDGSAHANTQNPQHSFTASSPTTEHVTLTVTDSHGGTGTLTKEVPVTPGGQTCGNNSGSSVSCPLTLTQKSTVTITLTSVSCNADGDALMITAPITETVFTDGCHETQGTVFTINGGSAFNANTDLVVSVTSGSTDPNRIPPAVSITGTYPTWTLNFDDGEDPTGPHEPDFNDLVLTVQATPAP